MVNNAQDKKYGTEHLLVFTPVYASYFIVGLLCYVMFTSRPSQCITPPLNPLTKTLMRVVKCLKCSHALTTASSNKW